MTTRSLTLPAGRNVLGRLRLIAQSLATADDTTPEATVQRMKCLQAQDFRAARSAIALRSGCSVTDVDAAINAGSLVRSWPMRGTLHVVPARELRWMLRLNAGPTLRSARRRHEQLGITERDVEHALGIVTEQLRGGHGLDRAAIFAVWERHGIATSGQRGAHLVQTMCLREHLVLGPIAGTQQRFVLFDEWIPDSAPADRAANVAHWAMAYFRSHGPATLADFRWWSGLLQRDVAPVWDEVSKGLVEIVHDGSSYFAAPETLDRWADARRATARTLLTPAFDEILLGYADRTATVRRDHLDLVVPGGNGMFKATVLDGGRAVATWRRGPAREPANIAVSPFGPELSTRAQDALPRLARTYPFAP